MVFNACLKKDFKSLMREKKGWGILGISLFCVLMSILSVLMLSMLNKSGAAAELGELSALFDKTYMSSTTLFMSLVGTYGVIFFIVFTCTMITKELKNRQWILPINAGIKPTELFLSKIVSSIVWITLGLVVAFVIHLVFTVSACSAAGVGIGKILLSYLFMWLYIVMLISIVHSVNFMAKKTWPGVVVALCLVMLLPDIFYAIKIGSTNLEAWTPLVWYSDCIGSLTFNYSIWQVLTQALIFVGITVGLPLIALSCNKVKAAKE